VACLALARALSRLVFGIGLADPLTFVAGPAVLLALSMMASYFPARRAMRLDPIATLKNE
jgi:putative ABC transport system permease protein